MRFYNKDYVNKKRYLGCLEDYSPIEDRESYSEEDIRNIYDRKLQERLLQAEKDFNTPIYMIEERKDIEEHFDEKRYPKYDLVGKRIVGYQTKEEVLKAYDYQVEKQKKAFDNRGSFDVEKNKRIFENNYQFDFLSAGEDLPLEYRDRVDRRLLALHVLPKKIYEEIEKKIEEDRLFLADVDSKAKTYFDSFKDRIPKKALEVFSGAIQPIVYLHLDEDQSLTFLFYNPGILMKGKTGYRKVIFSDGKVISKDEELDLKGSFRIRKNYPDALLFQYVEHDIKDTESIINLLLKNKDGNLLELDFSYNDVHTQENYFPIDLD